MNDAPPQTALPVRAYRGLICGGSQLQSFALLVLRLGIGCQLFYSGRGHLTHIEKTVQAFQEWGVPMARLNVYISGTTELVGGILILLGLASRLISIPLIINFCVAYLAASRDALKHILTDPNDVAGDTAFPFLAASLIILAFGPGWISLDGLIKAIFFKRPAAPKTPPELGEPGARNLQL